ncbi:putative gustatory receptor 28b isoform X2 [Bradysia coprophila]|uniref:putative gustatory receptor 28b isoform X2 n=1 Tax=Bradysia coprophila TaxID=38358 RepID=UPI00187D8346|nr:putative gustatory receptor 28b isoform X2 [Bradysia coprophila]
MEKLKAKCKQLKKWAYPTDIYSSQRPLAMTLILEGLFPFKIVDSESKRALRFSKIGYVVAAFHIVFFTTCFILTIYRQESFVVFFFPTDLTRVGGYLQFITSIVAMAAIFGSCLYSAKKIQMTMDNIVRIDEKFRLLAVKVDYMIGFKLNVGCVISFLIVNFAFTFLSFILLATAEKDTVPGFAVWTSYFVPPFIISIVIIHFVCIAFQIKQRLSYANGILRNLCGSESTKSFNVTISPLKSFKQSQDSSSNLLAERKLVEVVKDVCGIHDDLSDTCLLAEEYFALKMLTIVGIGFLIIVFNLYYVMEIAFGQIPDEFQEESYKFLIFLVFQVAMNILGILCIIQSSCAISNENRNCSIYVHKLMNTTTDDIAKEKLLQFSLQLIHRKVKFTALNLFPLDRTLIFTIAGAATTYLIILFQFSNQNRFPNVKT